MKTEGTFWRVIIRLGGEDHEYESFDKPAVSCANDQSLKIIADELVWEGEVTYSSFRGVKYRAGHETHGVSKGAEQILYVPSSAFVYIYEDRIEDHVDAKSEGDGE